MPDLHQEETTLTVTLTYVEFIVVEVASRFSQEGYASDNLDEPESPKKQKVSKAAAAKAKAKKKKKADDDDSDEDAYTALSKSMWTNTPKPSVGSFANCATCEKQFTVVRLSLLL
jgi:DNA repair protein RAD7